MVAPNDHLQKPPEKNPMLRGVITRGLFPQTIRKRNGYVWRVIHDPSEGRPFYGRLFRDQDLSFGGGKGQGN